MNLLLIAVFIICMSIGMPIVFALGIPGAIYILLSGIPPLMIPTKMFTGVDVFVLLALTLFIVSGNLMNASGISKRLLRFCVALVGTMPGGLAMVNVVSSMFFAGITGAGSADIAALGTVLIPEMKKQGYPAGFCAAITSVSSSVGPIIPPSILMVVYGYVAHVSVASLFIAGIIPGIIIGLSLMVTVYIVSVKNNYQKGDRFEFSVVIREFKSAYLALLLPIIIVGGMGFGIMTPTEVSAVAVVLAFVLGKFIYKELKWSDIPGILANSAILAGGVGFILATSNVLLYAVTLEQVADKIGIFFLSITQNKILILMILNMLLLFLGAIVDCLPLMIMFVPIIKPLFVTLGVDPIHAGVFVVFNMVIGLSTPPVGTSLFIATSIARTDLQTSARYMVPFLVCTILVLFLITYVPQITLWLPSLL